MYCFESKISSVYYVHLSYPEEEKSAVGVDLLLG